MNKKFLSILLTLVLACSLCLVTAVPVAAQIFYDVDPTMSTPEINNVIATVGEGAVVRFADGTYNLTETLVVGGQAGVTLEGNIASPQNVILDGGGIMGPGVHITATDITFHGFTVTNFTCDPYAPPEYPSGAGMGAIWVIGDGAVIDGNIINNIRSTAAPGDLTNPDMWPAGIGIDVAASDVEVTGNLVYDVDSIGIRVRSDYEEAAGDTEMTGILVEGNTVHDTANTCFVVAGYVTGLTIKGNEIYNSLSPNPYSLWILVAAGHAPSDVTVEGNTISGGYANVWILGANTITISGNTITGAIPHCDDPFATNGKNIRIQGASSAITITNNDILGADGFGVHIQDDVADVATILINNNNILGNTDYGAFNQTAISLDATGNWWGTTIEAEIVAMVSGPVNYTPWLEAAPTWVEMTASSPGEIIGISVSPTSVNFGSLIPGTPSDSQTVTVTNTGNVPENFSATIENESPAGVYTGIPGLEINLDLVSAWLPTGVAVDGIEVASLVLTVPSGTAAGTYTATLVFWAEMP